MRIIVGVDGSAGSLEAVQLVGRLLTEETDPLYFYYSPPSISLGETVGMDPETVKRVEQALVDAVFDRAKEQLALEHRERVVTIRGTHKAKHGLLSAAEQNHADLVVVGSHGVRPLEWLRIGSVSRAVAQTAHVPVLVVRPCDRESANTFRVLLTCDRTELADFTKSFVQRFAWPAGTRGDVMTVYESYIGEVPEWLQETLIRESGVSSTESFEPFAEDKQRAREQVESWCEDLPPMFCAKPPELIEGHAAHAIVDRLKSESYDLVVVGARRQGVVGRMLLGSTSYAVLNHAPCSVLIVREHEAP